MVVPGTMAAVREHGYYAVTPTNRLALVSMVFGIVSYGLVPLIGGVVAVLTGHMALSQIQRTREAGEVAHEPAWFWAT